MQKSPHLLAGTEIYRPLCTELQQIRLLTILPGSGDEELRCHLSTASLHPDLRPFYETISYAWRDRDLRANLVVNNSALNIPRATKDALRCMRLANDERVVWIDAVCINQNDTAERGAQVSIMASIYMNGAKNLIFLGNDEENAAETTIATLDRTHRDVRRHFEHRTSECRRKLRACNIPLEEEFDFMPTKQDVAVLEALFGLPWFSRLWVVQETAFAFRSICYWGSIRFPLSPALLVAAALPQTRYEFDKVAGVQDCYRARGMSEFENFLWRGPRSRGRGLAHFTGELEDFSASEPRDRVFAAVQLYLKWNDMLQVPPLLVSDYSKPVADVYRDATRFILSHEGMFYASILRRVRHRSSQDLAVEKTGSTSWTIKFDRAESGMDPNTFGVRFAAGGNDNAFVHEFLNDSDPNLLIIKALLVDTVTTTTAPLAGQVANEHAQTKDILEALQGWANQATTAEVLTTGRSNGETFQFIDSSKRVQGYHSFCQYVFTLNRLPPVEWRLDSNSTREEIFAALFGGLFRDSASNRRFFLTRNRRIGCGPKLMKAGDVVFVIKAAPTACILRPVEGKDQWLYVGEAYVHGIMHGEIFDQGEINWEWVKLR